MIVKSFSKSAKGLQGGPLKKVQRIIIVNFFLKKKRPKELI